MQHYYVYMLSDKRNGAIYLGMTNDLLRRVAEHKQNVVDGFSKKYKTHWLVWYEVHETAETAIQREKQIKPWRRQWKKELIEERNPDWNDLYERLNG